jgi:anti-sigma factor RsiW
MHVINVFVVNKEGSQNHASKLGHMRGFNIRHWTAQGLEFLAVSDLNSEELLDFVNKFETAVGTA